MKPLENSEDGWFEKNLSPHESVLRSWLACRFPGVRSDSEDIVQEAFMKVLAAREKREIDCPKTFLFAVARNLAIDFLRQKKVIPMESLGETDGLRVLDSNADIPNEISRIQEQRMLHEAIESLPRRCREVITLRKVYGLSHKAIAKRLGISVKTIEVQVSIGVRKIRDYCSHYTREWQS